MIATFDGHRAYWKGKRPKRPVLWQGTIYANGPAGKVVQVPWKSLQPMTYEEAQEAIIEARLLGEKELQRIFNVDPVTVSFQLRCR